MLVGVDIEVSDNQPRLKVSRILLLVNPGVEL